MMKKKNCLLISAIYLSTLLFSINSFSADKASCDLNQDKCSAKPLDEAEANKSLFLADQINQQLEDMYNKSKLEGKDLKVVIIGRQGSDLTKFKILKDNNGKDSLAKVISDLLAESKAAKLSSEIGSVSDSASISYDALLSKINKSENLKYSHLGIAFRNLDLKHPDDQQQITGVGTGKWAFYHLLYACKKPEFLEQQGDYIKSSHIFKGTVQSFFFDRLSGYDAEFIVPTQMIQDNLENILLQKRQAYSFQQNHYNAAAKIDDLSQQNSNQFVAEALAAALKPEGQVTSRETALQVLKETGFAANKLAPTGLMSVMTLPFIQNLISGMMPTVCLKSQPDLKKYGIGEIVTANSVVSWMERNNMVDYKLEIGISKNVIKELEPEKKAELRANQNP
jgi:hypothetical protein